MQQSREHRKPAGNASRRHLKNMGKRAHNVVPVGAWVELEPSRPHANYGAILSAEQEERRILQTQAEKQAKLDRFRRDVKERVRQLNLAKKQEQLQESFQAVELQSNVVQQSSHAAESATPKKDRCLYRHGNEALSIGQSSDYVTSGSESELDSTEREQLTERSEQVHRIVSQAKRSLAAKQMFQRESNIPGGHWGTEFTRDPQHTESGVSHQDQVIDLEEQATGSIDSKIPQQPIEELSSYGDMESHSAPVSQDSLHPLAGIPAPKTVTFAGLGNAKGQRVRGQNGKGDERLSGPQKDFLHEDLGDGHTRLGSRGNPSRKDEKARRRQARNIPDLKPGVQVEENKRRMGHQFSMYRRLFMDIEREQVKENIRKKEHQKNIQRLKEEKEKERRRIEAEAHQSVEPRNLLTGETEEEIYQRQREEQEQMEQVLQRERDKKKKSTELTRYIRALKAMMREKIEQMEVEVPPLCACAPSIWDTNPETCANNCLFYKNPKAYAKALHSLLMSCELG